MKFNCKRDLMVTTYDMNPSSDTVEDLFVLIASDFQIPLEHVAVRCGSFPSWNSDQMEKRLADLLMGFTPPSGPVPLTIDLHVMTREAAATLDQAAARITNLFTASSGPTTSSPVRSNALPRLEDEAMQRRLYEDIQRRNIEENLQSAYEHTPEAFVSVTMLYINVCINNIKLKAFVDSGAQTSIMNVKTAERCGLLRLVDRRMRGVAYGVGKQTIIGRIHLIPVQMENIFIPFSFSVLEEQKVDVIIGLDQLKRHQFLIDLKENCLRLNDSIIPFLPDNEIPDFAQLLSSPAEGSRASSGSKFRSKGNVSEGGSGAGSPGSSTPAPVEKARVLKQKNQSPPPLPALRGTEQRHGTPPLPPRSTTESSPVGHRETPSSKRRRLVQQLMSFTGMMSDSEAMAILDIANWDVETAASIYFAQMEEA